MLLTSTCSRCSNAAVAVLLVDCSIRFFLAPRRGGKDREKQTCLVIGVKRRPTHKQGYTGIQQGWASSWWALCSLQYLRYSCCSCFRLRRLCWFLLFPGGPRKTGLLVFAGNVPAKKVGCTRWPKSQGDIARKKKNCPGTPACVAEECSGMKVYGPKTSGARDAVHNCAFLAKEVCGRRTPS